MTLIVVVLLGRDTSLTRTVVVLLGRATSLTLTAVVLTNKSLIELRSAMQKLPQTMINVSLSQPSNVSENQSIREGVSSIEEKLNGRGRVLLRPSGTEPVLRVMVEGEDSDQVAQLARELADLVAAESGEFA